MPRIPLALAAVDRSDVPPLPISARLRSQLVYFATASGSPGVPILEDGEYWIDAAEVDSILADGVLSLVSPLDTDNKTEVELSEEQETMLTWLQTHKVQHLRVVE